MSSISEEAVEDMADEFDDLAGDPREPNDVDATDLMRRVGDIGDIHDVDDRVDLACQGLERWFDRMKMDTVGEFREFLETMEQSL